MVGQLLFALFVICVLPITFIFVIFLFILALIRIFQWWAYIGAQYQLGDLATHIFAFTSAIISLFPLGIVLAVRVSLWTHILS